MPAASKKARRPGMLMKVGNSRARQIRAFAEKPLLAHPSHNRAGPECPRNNAAAAIV